MSQKVGNLSQTASKHAECQRVMGLEGKKGREERTTADTHLGQLNGALKPEKSRKKN